MISLHRFYFDSILRARKTGERYGQALFNHLCEVRPELSEKVRATGIDPFFLTGPQDNPQKWDEFIEFIETRWRETPISEQGEGDARG